MDLHEGKWLDPPDDKDTFGEQINLDWLVFITTVDNLHEWGLQGITRMQRALPKKCISLWNLQDRLI